MVISNLYYSFYLENLKCISYYPLITTVDFIKFTLLLFFKYNAPTYDSFVIEFTVVFSAPVNN
jgi:hypothetical protein